MDNSYYRRSDDWSEQKEYLRKTIIFFIDIGRVCKDIKWLLSCPSVAVNPVTVYEVLQRGPGLSAYSSPKIKPEEVEEAFNSEVDTEFVKGIVVVVVGGVYFRSDDFEKIKQMVLKKLPDVPAAIGCVIWEEMKDKVMISVLCAYGEGEGSTSEESERDSSSQQTQT